MGTQLPLKDTQPQFSAHVYCGQSAGWIKMPLGTEVDLSPEDIVLEGTQIGRAAPVFSAHVYCGHGRPSQLSAELLLHQDRRRL